MTRAQGTGRLRGAAYCDLKRSGSQMPLKMNNLLMPDSFPADQFDRIYQTVANRYRQHPNYSQYQGAWNAVAYRYKAMVEHDERFTASIVKDGPAPGEPTRFDQERDLFGFASSAYSMFDALHYGMFAIGSFIDASNFPLSSAQDERRVSFRSTQTAYSNAFGGDPIIGYFSTFSADAERVDLDALRNMLTHRASPPRAFRLGGVDRLRP
jgi:hypothetical protein